MEGPDHRPKSLRPSLIQLAGTFVQGAILIPGVTRVALLGSITTGKPTPKDVDLLVTVEDTADLTPLAVIGRRLKGKAASLGSGADIFLANPRGDYIGRICDWKDCRPGVRVRCDALNCGRRHFLHDDLKAVILPSELVRSPPVVLWPEPRWSEPVPPDLLPLREMSLDGGPYPSRSKTPGDQKPARAGLGTPHRG
ncbi:MAG: hypothetical protein JRN35_04800 [Nitrososphaerota archaeon]|nr:hypothetical protein [Nitrososphaerota archaeon]